MPRKRRFRHRPVGRGGQGLAPVGLMNRLYVGRRAAGGEDLHGHHAGPQVEPPTAPVILSAKPSRNLSGPPLAGRQHRAASRARILQHTGVTVLLPTED
jgi:hypothetical protein